MTDDYTKHLRLSNHNRERLKLRVEVNKKQGKKSNLTIEANKLLDEILSVFEYD